jgi:hypothetical protein
MVDDSPISRGRRAAVGARGYSRESIRCTSHQGGQGGTSKHAFLRNEPELETLNLICNIHNDSMLKRKYEK